jgi:hypothetical protein
VEVGAVLDPNEKLAFDNLVTQLRTDDPRFLRRVGRLSRPKRRLRTPLALLLWISAPISIVYGGWTGVIFAVVAICCGARLIVKSDGKPAGFSWWSSSPHRPGATSL